MAMKKLIKPQKGALTNDVNHYKIPFTDFKLSISQYINSSWQTSWDAAVYNKLHSIKPVLGEWRPAYRSTRREEVVIARCRIGHTRLTHSYLLNKEEPVECIPCAEPFTVEHFLLNCIDFAFTRQKYYSATSMKTLFESTNMSQIIDFLKEINLYHKL